MDDLVFFCDKTEQEIRKQLEIRIKRLQTLRNEIGYSGVELSSNDSFDDLLNNLAYEYVNSGKSLEEITNSEIQQLTDQINKMSAAQVGDLEETVSFDDSYENDNSVSSDFNDTLNAMEQMIIESTALNVKCEKDVDIPFQEEKLVNKDVSEMIEHFSCDFSKNYQEEEFISYLSKPEPGFSKENDIPISPTFKLPVLKKQILIPGHKALTPSANKLYKDIKSPVAFYIKNSGSTPARKHLKFSPEKHMKKAIFDEDIFCEAFNEVVFPSAKQVLLPEIFYKPAAAKIVSKEQKTKLPTNIKKLVGCRPEIIIHELRIKKGGTKSALGSLFATGSNYSFTNEDTSIYVTKQAEIV